MDVSEIQANLGGSHQQEFERFCEMKVRYMLQSEKGLVWCRAPGCGAGQIHVGGSDLPIVTCQKCGSRTCFTHDAVWHEGKTCAEYTAELVAKANAVPARALESKKSETWIKSHTKQCPGEGCGRPIQKNDGCDHMTCRKPAGCGQEFCWVCLAPYGPIREKGNKEHKSSCRYYS
ncbi:putative E3 ubiquitin-protein ligase rbrA [Rhizoctonia solani]|nr:putative E3 ubiquitin-protein ligase rbrA [Rhizoctonia solani]